MLNSTLKILKLTILTFYIEKNEGGACYVNKLNKNIS